MNAYLMESLLNMQQVASSVEKQSLKSNSKCISTADGQTEADIAIHCILKVTRSSHQDYSQQVIQSLKDKYQRLAVHLKQSLEIKEMIKWQVKHFIEPQESTTKK